MFSLKQVVKAIVAVPAILGTAALILMMLQIVLDVFLRSVFSVPLPLTTIFVANYYMIIVAFIPLALAEMMDRHISVEVVVQYLPKTVQRWLHLITCIVTAVASAGLAWRMWEDAMKHFASGSFIVQQDIKAITWPSYFALPIGFALLSIMVLIRIITILRNDSSVFVTDDDTDIPNIAEK